MDENQLEAVESIQNSEVVRIYGFIRPHKLEAVKSAIALLGVSGMTVADARGRGNSEEQPRWVSGDVYVQAIPIRSRLEVLVPADLTEQVLACFREYGATGEPNDGKVFVMPVTNVIRVRTGEDGIDAV